MLATVQAKAHLRSDLRFFTLTTSQGLSQATVYQILQDSKGFIWLATRDGLNRFDGYNFKIYRHDPNQPHSLSASFIQGIAEDREGILWVATRRGLNRLRPNSEGRFDRFLHDPKRIDSFPTNRLTDIAIDRNNTLWLLADDMLIRATFDGLQFDYDIYPCNGNPNGLPKERMRHLYLDETGPNPGVWAGSIGEGLYFMAFDRPGHFEAFTAHPTEDGRLRGNFLRDVMRDRSGVLWVATEDGGLHKMTEWGVFKQFAPEPQNPHAIRSLWINALHEDRHGNLWVGSYDKGLFLMEDRNANRFFHFPHKAGLEDSLSSNQIWDLNEDDSGQMWIGTYGGGAIHFNPKGRKFHRYTYQPGHPSLNAKAISAVAIDDQDGIWVGTTDSGLNYIRRQGVHQEAEFTAYTHDPNDPKSLPDNFLTCLALDQSNKLWLGSRKQGLIYMDLEKPGQFRAFPAEPGNPNRLPEHRVAALYPESDGVWVGTDLGVSWTSRHDLGNFRTFSNKSDDPRSISHNWIMDLHRDPSGILWIATYGGGLNKCLDERNGTFYAYRHQANNPQSLSDDAVRTIYGMPDGTMWIGTVGGLNHFDPRTEQFKVYRTADGLPNDVIYSIEADQQGHIWVSTNLGLGRLNPETDQFTNFDIHDGLQDTEFHQNASAQSKQGEMVFGGLQGLTLFHPKNIKPNLIPPIPSFTELKVANRVIRPIDPSQDQQSLDTAVLKRPIEDASHVQLHYSEPNMTISFTALHYELPIKHRFQYMLYPFETEWRETDASTRLATYTNLPSGSYQFHLKASNSDGIWSPEARILDIYVTTPPWKSWWARLCYVTLILLVIAWYMRTQKLKLDRERLKVEHLKQVEKLKDEFNAQLEQKVQDRTRELQGTRRKLVETARLAGMAEIASDVLHGVGNSLNSVKTSIHFMQELVEDERYIELIERLASKLAEAKDSQKESKLPKKNKDLEKALKQIASKLRKRQHKIDEESQKLFQQVQSIIGVLWDQQKHTQKKDWSLEMVDLNQTIEEALYFDGYILRERDILVNLDLGSIPPVNLDKTKVSRIFYFLFKNAAEAIAQARKDKGMVCISSHQDGLTTVCTIKDNGCGIDPKLIDKIFVHGYTTKESHEGFGLHYCANAMKEMAGTITVESHGDNQGTSVHLCFPQINYHPIVSDDQA